MRADEHQAKSALLQSSQQPLDLRPELEGVEIADHRLDPSSTRVAVAGSPPLSVSIMWAVTSGAKAATACSEACSTIAGSTRMPSMPQADAMAPSTAISQANFQVDRTADVEKDGLTLAHTWERANSSRASSLATEHERHWSGALPAIS